MEMNREKTQVYLLRILGVLLILVGFSMIFNHARSADNGRLASTRCIRSHIEHAIVRVPAPPAPPAPPVLTPR